MEPIWYHSFVSPCEKIVYLAQYKVMSQSMEVFLREKNWKSISIEDVQASQTKLVLMRDPRDRLKSALIQAQTNAGLDNDIIDLIFSKKMLLIDSHITGFIGNLRFWEDHNIENLLQNLVIIPINDFFPSVFNLFFKKFNYDYDYNDVPKLNVSLNKTPITDYTNFINGLLELDLDTRLWDIIDTQYRWYRLGPDYKKTPALPNIKVNVNLNDIINNVDSLRYITKILKAIKN